MDISKNTLLTGAGFTKNFGGLLAKKMWSIIFNNSAVQSQARLRALLLNDFDYESIYHKVINGDYTEEEKGSINSAIFEAYHTIDKVVSDWTFRQGAPNPVNIGGINKFIERFSGQRPNTIGFFFTLNQDLFIERYFSGNMEALDLPYIQKIPDAHKRIIKLPLERQDFIKLPTKNDLDKSKNKFSSRTIYYVKLHGSYGWISSGSMNGFVIGKDKETQLAQEPLLSCYFDLFKRILSEPDCKLFVIGYGFRDKHINNVIAESASKTGLKMYVISPTEQSIFIDNLKNAECGQTMLDALKGYFPYTLLDIFPQDQSESYAYRAIFDSYFT